MGYQVHVERVMVYSLEEFFKRFNIPYEYNKGKHYMELYNGATILFGSSENPESLEGPHVEGGAWMDECGYMDRIAWEVVQRRTSAHDAPVLLTSVPYYENWLKSDCYEPFLHGDQTIEWITCATMDNKEYPTHRIEQLKQRYTPQQYEIYVMGNFARAAGLIWPDPPDEQIVVTDMAHEFRAYGGEIPDDWPLYVGLDWGYNAPTAAVWGVLSPDDVLYLVAEYEVAGMTPEDHVQYFRQLGLYGVDQGWGDPSAPEEWDAMNRDGFPVMKAKDAVNHGISVVYDRLLTGRLKVLPGLRAWLDYRARYVWDADRKDREKLLDKPKKDQEVGHLMDATRYLCAGLVEYGAAPGPPVVSVGYRQMGSQSNARISPEVERRLTTGVH